MGEQTNIPQTPTYRHILVAICLLLGIGLTTIGVIALCRGIGAGAVTILCGGANFVICAMLVRFQGRRARGPLP